MSAPCIVLTTAPSRHAAERLATVVLEARLAACVQMLPITSAYWWDGKIERSEETLLLCKTMADKYDALRDAIVSEHPYDMPEILQVPVGSGLDRYVAWLDAETRPRDG